MLKTDFRALRTVLLLALAAALVYVPYLDDSPIYLAHDEVFLALQAQSIAVSAHDMSGRFLPLYFHIFGAYWAQSILIYFTSLF